MKKLILLMLAIGLLFSSCEKDSIDQYSDFQKNKVVNEHFDKSNLECGECDGKINELVLLYNGNQNATVKVETKKNGENGSKIVFNQNLQPNETFSFVGNDKKGTLGTQITIYVNGFENTKIHTSCSIPVGPGFVSGDFEVISGSSRNGGYLCPIASSDTPVLEDCNDCDGKINQLELLYNGSVSATIVVETKKVGENGSKIVFNDFVQPGETFSFVGNDKKGTLGTQITIFINGEINTKIHTSCSVPVGPGMISGDFEVISGTSRNGGNLCPIDNDDDDTTPNPEDCNDCDGKINQLELLYNGSVSATIVVETKKVGENGSKIVFNDFVQPGETFSFVGNDKKGTLGTQITIFINGEINTKIHTSCSVPVGPGMISGDFEVISGSSRNGGDLCPLETEPNNDCPCDGNIISMTVIYDGPNGATVSVGVENDGSDALQTFNNVLQGDILNIALGDVGDWWYISVNDSVDASIHTSCSDIITGNVDANISDFGSLGYFPNPIQNTDNATFFVILHTDNNGNTCSISAG